MTTFRDRRDAGEQLAERIAGLRLADPFVLALPRGGVPVAHVVATVLKAPLDVVVARKVGAPGNPEFGVGAVTADGPALFDTEKLNLLGVDPRDLEPAVETERAEARRRLAAYRDGRPEPELAGRDVVLVDDGLATGVTARAGLSYVRGLRPASLRLAVPVCSADSARSLGEECDEVVCLSAPPDFRAVGLWYQDFRQNTDEEVIRLLRDAG
ncbi:putative phosphoribosyltransferase [Spinactinospora alkalitolerans]|uniref:Putative phosphoribosyltransferase n=1 Tax=Spinactinospora alkalitolerans TaxID=687207 RepID=A0A852U5D5_9ACTN|nr:phosphoribosyltransferase family protein [Spinactinospora alkalitolerans]NYE50775.1 putative phosphoribosyltransferase [Spinactinospora alkalitolerans]